MKKGFKYSIPRSKDWIENNMRNRKGENAWNWQENPTD